MKKKNVFIIYSTLNITYPFCQVFIIFSTLNPILFVRFRQNLINEHHLDPFSSLKNLKCKKNGRIRLDPVPDPKHWIFCFILRKKNTKYQCCFAGIGARGAEII